MYIYIYFLYSLSLLNGTMVVELSKDGLPYYLQMVELPFAKLFFILWFIKFTEFMM